MAPTHYGFNHTHIGQSLKPSVWRKVPANTPLRHILEKLVDEERRLCRIWLRYPDESTRCVYWWERDVLDTQLCKEN